jgi:hypothetical protein
MRQVAQLTSDPGTSFAIWNAYEQFSSQSLGALVNTELFPVDQEVAELSLLLPRRQALALVEAAQLEGMTAAQFVRRLIAQALGMLAVQQHDASIS